MDKYTWVDYGSSYLPSDLNAAYLWGQLECAEKINNDRLHTWNRYHEAFLPLQEQGLVQLPCIPEGCIHNAHMYYLKFDSLEQRTRFISYLKERGIQACFHYIPLHSSPAGMRFGSFFGEDENTTKISEQLVRLPLYYGLTESDRNAVIRAVLDYFEQPGF